MTVKKKHLILDTSLFVNPACAHYFGNSPTAALTRFLEMAEEAHHLDFSTPPSGYAELMHFADEQQVPKKLLLLVQKKAPKKHELRIPGIFLYQLVEEMRDRVDRGLRLAERHVREALLVSPPPAEQKPSPEKIRADAEIIGRLRETHRRIMREGMLDSKADVDLLLLTYEVDGVLVTGDGGLQAWAENLGLVLLSPDHLHDLLSVSANKPVL